jgi:hypothetical protein
MRTLALLLCRAWLPGIQALPCPDKPPKRVAGWSLPYPYCALLLALARPLARRTHSYVAAHRACPWSPLPSTPLLSLKQMTNR